MTKRVLDVGNCAVDHAAIRELMEEHFDAVVLQAHAAEDTLAELRRGGIDLVLVNRKLDCDCSDGLEVIRRIKRDPAMSATPCMLVTNYPEHQQLAVEAGAEWGFGKRELHQPQTLLRLQQALEGCESLRRPTDTNS